MMFRVDQKLQPVTFREPLGDAFPMLPDLYRARARVVAQVMAPEMTELRQWPPAAQQVVIDHLVALGARAFWVSRGRDGYSVMLPR